MLVAELVEARGGRGDLLRVDVGAAALSRQGRYKTVAGNLQVKEVRLPDAGDRFIVCFNPDQAVRDAAVRARLISQPEELIAGSDKLTVTKRAELRGKISMMPGLNRFPRVTPGGLLRTDRAKAKGEENLDGKYLLRSADPAMTAEDIAAGYRQLLEVGARLAGHEIRPGPAPGLSPARRAHPPPCHLVLARTAAHPRRREQRRADLAGHAPRAAAHQPRHLHRPGRHLPAAHRHPQDRP